MRKINYLSLALIPIMQYIIAIDKYLVTRDSRISHNHMYQQALLTFIL